VFNTKVVGEAQGLYAGRVVRRVYPRQQNSPVFRPLEMERADSR
jgi:hypothetical protein